MMTRSIAQPRALILAALMACSACSGSAAPTPISAGGPASQATGPNSGTSSPNAGSGGGASPDEPGAAPASTDRRPATGELPDFLFDFDRVCTTQVGFAGATPYETTPVIHPVAVFKETGDPPTLGASSIELPAGWSVDLVATGKELAFVELIACARRVEEKANGTCDFQGQNGAPDTTLEMTDTTYELTVYAAATGKVVGEPQRLTAAPRDCPMLVFTTEGQTKYFNDPSDDQYINALKALVSPGS